MLPAAMPRFPVRKFTVSEYHRLLEIGVVKEDAAIELLEGWVAPKFPHSPRHDATIGKVSRLLARVVPADRIARVQSAITTADSEPEPDLAVVVGPDDR